MAGFSSEHHPSFTPLPLKKRSEVPEAGSCRDSVSILRTPTPQPRSTFAAPPRLSVPNPHPLRLGLQLRQSLSQLILHFLGEAKQQGSMRFKEKRWLQIRSSCSKVSCMLTMQVTELEGSCASPAPVGAGRKLRLTCPSSLLDRSVSNVTGRAANIKMESDCSPVSATSLMATRPAGRR